MTQYKECLTVKVFENSKVFKLELGTPVRILRSSADLREGM